MRTIFSYLRSYRLIVSVILVTFMLFARLSGAFGAVNPEPTSEPTATATPAADADPTPGTGPDGTGEPVTAVEPVPPPDSFCSTSTPPPVEGGAGSAGSQTDPCYVTVVLAPDQLDGINNAVVAMTWAMAVLVFCGIVGTLCIARGSRR